MAIGVSGVQRLRLPTTGELRDKVTFQQFTKVEDGSGGFEDGFTSLGEAWARILPASSFSQFLARQVDSRIDYQVDVRRTLDTLKLQRGDRIVWENTEIGQQILKIDSVEEIGNMKKWFKFKCIADRPED